VIEATAGWNTSADTGNGAVVTATLVAALRGTASTAAGAAAAVAAVVGSGPTMVLGIANPRSWAASDWAADVIPYLAYAVVAGLVADAARPEIPPAEESGRP
jgi:hypothetical protein